MAEVDGRPAGVLQSADQTPERERGLGQEPGAWPASSAVAGWAGCCCGRRSRRTRRKGRRAAGLGVDLTNPTGAYRLYESVGHAAGCTRPTSTNARSARHSARGD